MNIEKLVSNFFDKKRSESVRSSRKEANYQSNHKCYQPTTLSFQPKVNDMPTSIYKKTIKTQCSREEIIQRLYTDRRSTQEIRTIQKLKKEEKGYQQNCTFHPETNKNSKNILKTEHETDPFQRLYSQGITKKKLSQSLNFIERQNKQNYPFQPTTNYRAILNSETADLRPIHQRLEDIIKTKRDKLKQLQQTANDNQLQQKPKINEISEKIINGKDQFKKNILQRVSLYLQDNKKKKQQEALEHEKKVLKQCTFKPQINSNLDISTNFLCRQEDFLKKMEEKATSRMVRNSFQPEINKISEILVREDRQAETFEDKINRMTNDCGKRDKIQEIQREIYEQCTFVPQINIISKCIAAEHISHKCNHTRIQEEYNFKPKINKNSENLAKNAKMRKCQSGDLKESRNQYLKNLKMQMEYQELKQCTFKPKVNQTSLKTNASLADVRGIDKFTKKINKIQQMKIDEQDLKDRLFHKQKNYKSRKSTTPNQFKLSQGYNTKDAIKQQIRIKFEKECTFRPQIMSLR